jgi:hypothetical protein
MLDDGTGATLGSGCPLPTRLELSISKALSEYSGSATAASIIGYTVAMGVDK